MKTKLFYKIFAFTFGMMLLITVLAHVLIFMIAPSENVLITSTTVTNEDVLAFSEVDMPQLITQTILKSFPLSFACCMVISLVFSFLFSKGITGPILSISTSVHQMSKLDRTAEITVISTDEIGGLANDINSLYQSLLVTIHNSHRPNISPVISGYKQPSKSAQSIEITGFIEKSKPPKIIFLYTLLPLTA